MALRDALAAWEEALGAKHVVTADEAVSAAQRATFLTAQRIPAIIRPGSPEEVQACLRVANEYKIPVYPVSQGRNWGYGSRVPVRDGCVLMELARMNHIRDYSEELAYVTVEPGVTVGQLHNFLLEEGSELAVPFIGAGPQVSLLGNALERGLGGAPFGNRVERVCDMEVVLPNGELLQTGLRDFQSTNIGPLYRGALGPGLEDLFIQANFGVVTAMTVWLKPIPEHLQSCYFAINDEAQIDLLLTTIRALLLDGVFVPVVGLTNRYSRLRFALGHYPWDQTAGVTPLPAEVIRAAQSGGGVISVLRPEWVGFGYLSSQTQNHALALQEIIVSRIGELVDRLVFMGKDGAHAIKWDGEDDLSYVEQVFSDIRPRDSFTDEFDVQPDGAYWRKHEIPAGELDPDRDDCGIIFVTVLIPIQPSDFRKASTIITDTVSQHQLEPILACQFIAERVAILQARILFDRDVAGEDEKALACYDEVVTKLVAAGYPPHRLPIHAMGSVSEWLPSRTGFLNEVKRAVDPNDILAPGRYGIG